jgi:hypothetical protein
MKKMLDKLRLNTGYYVKQGNNKVIVYDQQEAEKITHTARMELMKVIMKVKE